MISDGTVAKDILAIIEAAYQPTHNYVEVDQNQFCHLDLRFYRDAQVKLQQHGFRYVADIEDVTLRSVPHNVLRPVMIRSMVSSDGVIMGGIYHPKPKLWASILLFLMRKRLGRIVDLETEFTDGSFVTTSNAEAAARMNLPPMIQNQYFSPATSIDVLYEKHLERVQSHLTMNPGIQPRMVSSHSEIRASQNRMNALKAAFRGEIGCISREELEKLSRGLAVSAAGVHDAIRKELDDRRAQPPLSP